MMGEEVFQLQITTPSYVSLQGQTEDTLKRYIGHGHKMILYLIDSIPGTKCMPGKMNVGIIAIQK